MKITFLTAAFAISSLLGINNIANAGTGDATTLTGISNISQIVVHGNVQVYLTTDNDDQVKVYNNYYAEDALVQEDNGVLRITSYSNKKLAVWVKAANVSKLSVFDDAEVTTYGQFSAIDMQVDLHNNAQAHLDVDAFQATFALYNHAKIDLSGTAEITDLQYDRPADINMAGFSATRLTSTVMERRTRHLRPLVVTV